MMMFEIYAIALSVRDMDVAAASCRTFFRSSHVALLEARRRGARLRSACCALAYDARVREAGAGVLSAAAQERGDAVRYSFFADAPSAMLAGSGESHGEVPERPEYIPHRGATEENCQRKARHA